MTEFIGTIRRELRLARVKLDILLNASDRRRRRRLAAAFPEPAEDLASGAVSIAFAQSGFAPWPISLKDTHRLMESWQAVEAARASGGNGNVERSTGKAFFEESLTLADLQSYPALVSVALEERLLRVVMSNLGMVPHLESVEVVVSHPTHGELTASQLWHRDVNDRRLLKLFVYLGDVDDAQGPFTYLPADLSASIPSDGKHYLTDDQVAPKRVWASVKGPAGTAFLIDTGRCYHCGSRCTKPRVAYIATYSCGIRYMKYASRWNEILGRRAQSLSALQRAVCGLAD